MCHEPTPVHPHVNNCTRIHQGHGSTLSHNSAAHTKYCQPRTFILDNCNRAFSPMSMLDTASLTALGWNLLFAGQRHAWRRRECLEGTKARWPSNAPLSPSSTLDSFEPIPLRVPQFSLSTFATPASRSRRPTHQRPTSLFTRSTITARHPQGSTHQSPPLQLFQQRSAPLQLLDTKQILTGKSKSGRMTDCTCVRGGMRTRRTKRSSRTSVQKRWVASSEGVSMKGTKRDSLAASVILRKWAGRWRLALSEAGCRPGTVEKSPVTRDQLPPNYRLTSTTCAGRTLRAVVEDQTPESQSRLTYHSYNTRLDPM
jgi:hypothetical protein